MNRKLDRNEELWLSVGICRNNETKVKLLSDKISKLESEHPATKVPVRIDVTAVSWPSNEAKQSQTISNQQDDNQPSTSEKCIDLDSIPLPDDEPSSSYQQSENPKSLYTIAASKTKASRKKFKRQKRAKLKNTNSMSNRLFEESIDLNIIPLLLNEQSLELVAQNAYMNELRHFSENSLDYPYMSYPSWQDHDQTQHQIPQIHSPTYNFSPVGSPQRDTNEPESLTKYNYEDEPEVFDLEDNEDGSKNIPSPDTVKEPEAFALSPPPSSYETIKNDTAHRIEPILEPVVIPLSPEHFQGPKIISEPKTLPLVFPATWEETQIVLEQSPIYDVSTNEAFAENLRQNSPILDFRNSPKKPENADITDFVPSTIFRWENFDQEKPQVYGESDEKRDFVDVQNQPISVNIVKQQHENIINNLPVSTRIPIASNVPQISEGQINEDVSWKQETKNCVNTSALRQPQYTSVNLINQDKIQKFGESWR